MKNDTVNKYYRGLRESVRDIARVLWRGWWVVLGCGLLLGAAGLTYSLLQTPQYRSTATLYVTSGTEENVQSAYQGSLASQQRVESYARLAKSNAVLREGIRRSGSSMTLEEAREAVTANGSPEAVLLTISAVDDNPQSAAALVNGIAGGMTSYVNTLEQPSGGGRPLAKLTVVTEGEAVDAPVAPRTVRNTGLGLVLGLLLGGAIVIARDRFDLRVRSVSDVESSTGEHILSVVPDDTQLATDGGLASFGAGGGTTAESYRKLRTNLGFANIDHPARKIVVSSATPGDGKTTTALNLAVSLAESGAKVVLVDADLRRPTVASRLKLSNAVGLTSALRGDVTIADAAQPSAVAGLDVITSGGIPPNPSELLGSNRTGQFFADLSAIYDYVVVDSPPVLPVTDSIELANWMDGVIVVLRSGKSRIPDLERVVEQLKMARAQILGMVLNGAKQLDAAYGYGYYQYDTVEPTEAPVVPVEQPKHAQAQA